MRPTYFKNDATTCQVGEAVVDIITTRYEVVIISIHNLHHLPSASPTHPGMLVGFRGYGGWVGLEGYGGGM